MLPDEHHPIALTGFLEGMVNFRLMWHPKSKHLLSLCQFGFQRTRSTADPLAHIDTYIKSAFARRDQSWQFSLIWKRRTIPHGDTTSQTNFAPWDLGVIWRSVYKPFSLIVLSKPKVHLLSLPPVLNMKVFPRAASSAPPCFSLLSGASHLLPWSPASIHPFM